MLGKINHMISYNYSEMVKILVTLPWLLPPNNAIHLSLYFEPVLLERMVLLKLQILWACLVTGRSLCLYSHLAGPGYVGHLNYLILFHKRQKSRFNLQSTLCKESPVSTRVSVD